ncbi:hypothetical protein ES288_D01G183000v1 [Gossypium darwinii]|uniref:Uncharacterized protein n=1 Tax=Gossypium darwinii TaxID=34276 RepID=A0A5D2DR41_GOSDA|nr:hypothetical protein ES288_D01G183000v1 [Gossypium darwinii]
MYDPSNKHYCARFIAIVYSDRQNWEALFCHVFLYLFIILLGKGKKGVSNPIFLLIFCIIFFWWVFVGGRFELLVNYMHRFVSTYKVSVCLYCFGAVLFSCVF